LSICIRRRTIPLSTCNTRASSHPIVNGAEALVTMVPTNLNRWAPMQPKSQRRVHGAEFKAQVLAECQQPCTSVAAMASPHGLNHSRAQVAGRPRHQTHRAASTGKRDEHAARRR
jgi:hypothetical protein